MNSVEFEAEIREEYWKKFSAEKPTTKAPTTRMKTVAVASDLALWEENETFVLGEAKGAKKKEIFLRTPLNIEMKQAGLLNWKQNRSALTQLSLQALARCKSRAEAAKDHKSMFHSEEEVFSILTDCTMLYVLRYDVKKGQYWMLRGITEPSKQAAALCWTCAHPDMAAPFDEAWNCQEQEDTKCDAIEPYSKAEEATDRSNLDKSRIRRTSS